ncbi:MAG: DUF5678 domain-containing protein [Caldilineaceae bacterium]
MATLTLDKSELVDQLHQIATARNTTAHALLDRAVREFLVNIDREQPEVDVQSKPMPDFPEFAREVAAFERLKPELIERYYGRVVAIYQGEVVAVGDDRMDVLGEVLERLGPVPCYIEWVTEQTPRRARITSAWIKR